MMPSSRAAAPKGKPGLLGGGLPGSPLLGAWAQGAPQPAPPSPVARVCAAAPPPVTSVSYRPLRHGTGRTHDGKPGLVSSCQSTCVEDTPEPRTCWEAEPLEGLSPLVLTGADRVLSLRTRGAEDTQGKDRGHGEQADLGEGGSATPRRRCRRRVIAKVANPSTAQSTAFLNKTRNPFPPALARVRKPTVKGGVPRSSAPAVLPPLSPGSLTQLTQAPPPHIRGRNLSAPCLPPGDELSGRVGSGTPAGSHCLEDNREQSAFVEGSGRQT